MSSYLLIASSLFALLPFANSFTIPQIAVRQDSDDCSSWHGGSGQAFAGSRCHRHGSYDPGEWGHDRYHGWNWPYAPLASNGSNNIIEVPATTPPNASPPVSPNFIGFAFEEASFPRYVQTRDGQVNQFSLNLIDAIMSRTGGHPIVRLGGTSADYARYIESQEEAALPSAEVYNYQDIGGTSIGPAYWDLCHIIPNSKYIVQFPMAHTNVSESVLWARTAAERIGIDLIEAFEPGNEGDLYSTEEPPNPGLGPPDFQGTLTNESYTGNFTRYVDAVKAAVDIPNEPFFQAFDVSTPILDNRSVY